MAPACGLTVERREAPHPYVIGVQRAFARRAADLDVRAEERADTGVRQGASQAPGASRRSMSLVTRETEKRGKGVARPPEQ